MGADFASWLSDGRQGWVHKCHPGHVVETDDREVLRDDSPALPQCHQRSSGEDVVRSEDGRGIGVHVEKLPSDRWRVVRMGRRAPNQAFVNRNAGLTQRPSIPLNALVARSERGTEHSNVAVSEFN